MPQRSNSLFGIGRCQNRIETCIVNGLVRTVQPCIVPESNLLERFCGNQPHSSRRTLPRVPNGMPALPCMGNHPQPTPLPNHQLHLPANSISGPEGKIY